MSVMLFDSVLLNANANTDYVFFNTAGNVVVVSGILVRGL
jgi:hypothetical protein